ncbi:MAG: terpene cyclase/mutase family protein [Planctomycetaceae bacterium]|nr:terpene cyclase/mutase family protein [Planctomycetaceae bacterium]
MREKAITFLKNTQAADGSWTNATQPGITGLVLCGLLDAGAKPSDPVVARGLKHLEGYRQKDGGIYHEKSGHKNYETCIAIMAFAKANTEGQYDELIKKADAYVRELQWDEGEKIDNKDVKYGGAGYGRTGDRPDLSNTAFLIDALKAAGAKDNDPSIQKALVFVSRSQNLETEHNTTPLVAKVNDGGFYYTPALGGQSQAGMTENGGLRSYASMTYAGLKSMLYAGLTEKDPRVKAAYDWARKHYTMSENPGMGQAGLYYYYHTLGKALSVMKVDQITDAQGTKHDWRKDLVAELKQKQGENGSWVNPADRWMEGDPNLVTSYVLVTLKYCEAKPAK